MNLQSVIRAIYPAQCVACDNFTEAENGLCGPCWAQTRFIGDTICDKCGAPLPGDEPDADLRCDDCLRIARPWDRGRAAMVYADVGRRLVLALKHGDRLDVAHPAALWMARAVQPLITDQTVIVPVPLHWTRMLKRRYNQAAELAKGIAKVTGCDLCVDGLHRSRRTKPLDRHTRKARFEILSDAIRPTDQRKTNLDGRAILLVDDVMTSGATLAAATEAAYAANAANVSIATLARVVKDT